MRAVLVFAAGSLVAVATLTVLLRMLRPRLRGILVDVLGKVAKTHFRTTQKVLEGAPK